MINSIQRILFLLVALFSVMAATPAKSETENVDKSFAVKSGGLLTIESDQGSIKVETRDKQTVEVLVEKKAIKQNGWMVSRLILIKKATTYLLKVMATGTTRFRLNLSSKSHQNLILI